MRVAIIGAAALGELIAHHAISDRGYDVVGYYDDFKTEAPCGGIPLCGSSSKIEADYRSGRFDGLIIGIGYDRMKARKELYARFKGQIPFVNVIHSSCYLDPSCQLGEGVVLLPGTVIDMKAVVGDNVLMNTHVTVAHHTRVGSHCFLAPGVHLAGLVEMEECCFIGIGSTVVDCIRVAPWSIVGAGSVVIKDTEPYSVSVGAPSRIIRYRRE